MTDRSPKISIITPSYNQGKFIESAIQSVLRQNHSNFEHIIIDNCSQDQTKEIVKKYNHLVWISEPDKGQSDALNKGFKIATGDLIGWLNADDLYLPYCFFNVGNYYLNNLDIDIFYGNYRWIDETGKLLQLRQELDLDLFILKYLHVHYIPTASVFFRRKIFEEDNYLDTSYNYAMDYEFFLRLALKGYKFARIPAYLADFRWHSSSKSTQHAQAQIEEKEKALLIYDCNLQKVPLKSRNLIRFFLKIMAMSKRYLLKLFKGYYFQQWNVYKRI
ncbi:MAG: glycosyltransferase [Hydrococcus sp. C42_A2020_068]|uniref:glycosyltransferase family 2 protein n=1 Tax=Pleurocapsa sp. PCC 7327 TaxID=118163 RepID=UPI00029FAFF7|nr:glycosyltransferase family 2 protein [Pleurocapsa sp. PCC 7327]AFY77511.1 putative glycosyltransferase [Pleurocapsa sp. PCC 7327]MBF2022267.1 glycosyltransferase [Hydrococcus sp. C42_A2020_068]